MTDATHAAHEDRGAKRSGTNWKGYANLLAMVATSTVVMYFFMYWNTYRLEDFVLSETRAFMAMLMGGTMLAIMLSFMLHMYGTRWLNLTLYGLSALLFAVGLYLLRSQVTVQDPSWMKSMIPHHSIAVMVSERAEITDPRARKLADEIIAAQEKEIAEMEYLIDAIEEQGEVGDDHPTGAAEGPTPIVSLQEALATPDISTIDPSGMTPQEVARMLGGEGRCQFRFSENQAAVLAVAPDGSGVMKITGQLVPLTAAGGSDVIEGPAMATDGARLDVTRLGDGDAAQLLFELDTDPALRVGYEGVYRCEP